MWLAGLMEGEGHFGLKKQRPRKDGSRLAIASIQLNMNDEDVVRRAHKIACCGRVGGPYGTNRKDTKNAKGYYAFQVENQAAIDLMTALLPHMGRRRTQQIRRVLAGHNVVIPANPFLVSS